MHALQHHPPLCLQLADTLKDAEMTSHFLVAESILYIIVWQKKQLSVQTRHWVVSIVLNGMLHCCGKAVQTALQLFFSLVDSEHRVLLLFLTVLAASFSFAVFMVAAVRSLPIGSVLTPLFLTLTCLFAILLGGARSVVTTGTMTMYWLTVTADCAHCFIIFALLPHCHFAFLNLLCLHTRKERD
ncbi:hypothetical protein TraAM80_06399 [Trypanosoma rangeli]|uniref:Uncharacterized protein n=1 Tax=Trypanosoma rangeli TaxID=5698 RepID=A0A3R7RGU5_TRYRA|nr:uncharacterized protein TraAM80_06399 [Trypanosoma rangeli]RNF02423.1 hypothetical protein TraAM80_06399 [Trypanosoma rangeli]|eukprot:RNF02423.1 hypothetical protein TraAM80_06399 [Trypanosoma rangeli]